MTGFEMTWGAMSLIFLVFTLMAYAAYKSGRVPDERIGPFVMTLTGLALTVVALIAWVAALLVPNT